MFVSLYIPDFPMMAALASQPEDKEMPCAILATSSGKMVKEKLPLCAVNRVARHTGIHEGWPLNRALVRCPSLKVLPADPERETSLREELIRLGESLTPDLELTAADTVTLDLSHRRTDQYPLPGKLVLEDVDLWQGSAATPDLAHLAARHRDLHGRMISATDLFPLPLDRLGIFSPSENNLTILGWWGIKTLGDFMNLPRQAVAERLGPETGHWHDVLHGKSCRLLRLHRPPESMAQRIEFEDAASTLDPVIFLLKRLLHTLAGRLAGRALAAGLLELKLSLESGTTVARRIRLPDPQTAVEGMLAPLQTWLESLRPEAAIIALELDAETAFKNASQRDWLRRELPYASRWAETLAKLEALLGPGRVGVPVPADSHGADDFNLRPAAGSSGVIPCRLDHPACTVPLQRYRPPRPIAVAHEWTEGRPVPLALLTGSHRGEIIGRRGPFSSSGTWWQPSEIWQRLEWDIQISTRHLLRLVFETPDRWQLEGIYR